MDGQGLISASDAVATEGDELVFGISLNVCTLEPISVSYQTSGQTAGSSDFETVTGTIVFQPDETYKEIRINTVQDSVSEGDETIDLDLYAAIGDSLEEETATGTIQDDEVGRGFTTGDGFTVNAMSGSGSGSGGGSGSGSGGSSGSGSGPVCHVGEGLGLSLVTSTGSGIGSPSEGTQEREYYLQLEAHQSGCDPDLTIPFTLSGTAEYGIDYTLEMDGSPITNQEFLFEGGNWLSNKIRIVPIDDTLDEDLETITIEVEEEDYYSWRPWQNYSLTVSLYENDATDDEYVTAKNQTLQVGLSQDIVRENDKGTHSSYQVEVVTNPSKGTLTLNSGGTFTYVPDEDYVGTDSFTYQYVDPNGSTLDGTVSVNVVSGDLEFEENPITGEVVTAENETSLGAFLTLSELEARYLRKLTIGSDSSPATPNGYYTLEYNDQALKVWSDGEGTQLVEPGITEFTEGAEATLYVEGVALSGGSIQLKWHEGHWQELPPGETEQPEDSFKKKGLQTFVVDTIAVNVVRSSAHATAELAYDFPESIGETFRIDDAANGDPRYDSYVPFKFKLWVESTGLTSETFDVRIVNDLGQTLHEETRTLSPGDEYEDVVQVRAGLASNIRIEIETVDPFLDENRITFVFNEAMLEVDLHFTEGIVAQATITKDAMFRIVTENSTDALLGALNSLKIAVITDQRITQTANDMGETEAYVRSMLDAYYDQTITPVLQSKLDIAFDYLADALEEVPGQKLRLGGNNKANEVLPSDSSALGSLVGNTHASKVTEAIHRLDVLGESIEDILAILPIKADVDIASINDMLGGTSTADLFDALVDELFNGGGEFPSLHWTEIQPVKKLSIGLLPEPLDYFGGKVQGGFNASLYDMSFENPAGKFGFDTTLSTTEGFRFGPFTLDMMLQYEKVFSSGSSNETVTGAISVDGQW